MSDLLERTELDTVTTDNSGDHDTFSHYVDKEDIVKSSMTGVPVFALCGKKWTPRKSPDKYPVCPECKDVLDNLWPEK